MGLYTPFQHTLITPIQQGTHYLLENVLYDKCYHCHYIQPHHIHHLWFYYMGLFFMTYTWGIPYKPVFISYIGFYSLLYPCTILFLKHSYYYY